MYGGIFRTQRFFKKDVECLSIHLGLASPALDLVALELDDPFRALELLLVSQAFDFHLKHSCQYPPALDFTFHVLDPKI